MDQNPSASPGLESEDPRRAIVARIGTAAGREQIAQDLRNGGYRRHSAALQAVIDESITPGANRADITARATREMTEGGLLSAAENPALRKIMTERMEDYARKSGLPFEPVGEGERWAQPHALSPSLPESARGRLEVTTDAVDRVIPGGQTYGAIASLTDRAATREGRAQIAEEICTGKVRGGIEDAADRIKALGGSDAKESASDLLKEIQTNNPAIRGFALHEADQPGSRDGVTEMAREHADRHGRPFEEVDPSEPWSSKRPMSEGSCYTASLDVGGAPNRSRHDVAQMIDRTDRQIAAESGSRAPVARGRDDALSL